MPTPSTMSDLSVTAASNSPAGSESPTNGDDFLRAIQAIIRRTNAKGSDIASATTTDIGAATAEFIDVTGTTTITGLGTIDAGIVRTVRFTGALTLTHNGTSLILPGSQNITTSANDIAIFRSLGSGNWICVGYKFQSGQYLLPSQLQLQTYLAFTTGGTSSAFTLTPTPALSANTTNARFNVTLNAAPSGSPTLAVSGLTAKNFKYYDSTGTKQFITSTVAPSGWNSDVIYDGTDWVMKNVLPPTASAYIGVGVRQTVASGTVDTNGAPNFGGSTGSTTVTTSTTLIATAANGWSLSIGAIDRIGSITNPSWTGLSTNGTMYLYLDIASDGTCTTGSTTLQPTYRDGGADVTTNGQFTFNINEMVGKVGNGSVATQTYRVFVGEVTVAGNVVTAIVWYALNGRYSQPLSATLPSTSTATSVTHNLGVIPEISTIALVNKTTESGYAVGDYVQDVMTQISGSATVKVTPISTYKQSTFLTANGNAFIILNKTTPAGAVVPTAANWYYKLVAKRGWGGAL